VSPTTPPSSPSATVTVAEGLVGGVVGDTLMFVGLGAIGLRLLRH